MYGFVCFSSCGGGGSCVSVGLACQTIKQSTTTYCDRFERNSVRTDRTSNVHMAELEQDLLMVDRVKSGTEIDLNNSSLLPPLQCTLYSASQAHAVGHHKWLSLTPLIPVSELDGLNYTSAFPKPTKTYHREVSCYVEFIRSKQNSFNNLSWNFSDVIPTNSYSGFMSFCSTYEQVFGKTLEHKSHISNSHT